MIGAYVRLTVVNRKGPLLLQLDTPTVQYRPCTIGGEQVELLTGTEVNRQGEPVEHRMVVNGTPLPAERRHMIQRGCITRVVELEEDWKYGVLVRKGTASQHTEAM